MNTRPPSNVAAIQSLKDQNWTVKIQHYRRPNKGFYENNLVKDREFRDSLRNLFDQRFYWREEISHFGGATELILQKGEEKIVVRADCYVKDRFARRLGVREALKKLESLYGIHP